MECLGVVGGMQGMGPRACWVGLSARCTTVRSMLFKLKYFSSSSSQTTYVAHFVALPSGSLAYLGARVFVFGR